MTVTILFKFEWNSPNHLRGLNNVRVKDATNGLVQPRLKRVYNLHNVKV